MKCRHCGRRIRFSRVQGIYIHDDGFATCDLDLTHPNFMMVLAEPDDNYCAEKEENGTCIHSDHTP